MKVSRDYVFVFLPILFSRAPRTRVTIDLRGGSNRSAPPEMKDGDTAGWRVRNRGGCDTQALPNHLFWTWFVDNPRL
jgi:hypothetical protein